MADFGHYSKKFNFFLDYISSDIQPNLKFFFGLAQLGEKR